MYVKIEDDLGNQDILRLTKTDIDNRRYDIYNISLNNYVSCENGMAHLSLFLLRKDTIFTTNIADLILSYDELKEGISLNIIDKVSHQLKELAKMNLKIYKDILEVTGRA